MKQDVNVVRKENVIYKILCRDCKLSYIGKTLQWYESMGWDTTGCLLKTPHHHPEEVLKRPKPGHYIYIYTYICICIYTCCVV